jgi:hypothetical protein
MCLKQFGVHFRICRPTLGVRASFVHGRYYSTCRESDPLQYNDSGGTSTTDFSARFKHAVIRTVTLSVISKFGSLKE